MSFKGLPTGMAIALETIAEPNEERIAKDRIIPTSDDLDNIEFVYFDIFTIVRDICREIPADEITSAEIRERLVETILALNDIPELMGSLNFFNSYSYMFRKKEHMVTHRDGTAAKVIAETITQFMSNLTDTSVASTGIKIETTIPFKNTLLYTHHIHYLAKMKKIGKTLIVLESHTGRVLNNITLNLKYRKSKVYDREKLPFTLRLLYLLGDGAYIKALGSKDIAIVVEASKEWTPSTSDSTILDFINKTKIINFQ